MAREQGGDPDAPDAAAQAASDAATPTVTPTVAPTASDGRSATLLAAALRYAARGWHIFPVHSPTPDRDCDCANPACNNQAKHPHFDKTLLAHGVSDATTDAALIRAWWAKWPHANIGLNAGKSGLVILDCDPRHGGDESLARLVVERAPAADGLSDTLIADTGGGGEHYLFAVTAACRGPGGPNKQSALRAHYPGLDVRAANSYIVLAPSLHASGAFYEWRTPDAPPSDLPAWLDAVMRERVPDGAPPAPLTPFPSAARDADKAAAYWLDRALALAYEGDRDNRCFWLCCQLRDDGVALATATRVAEAYAIRVSGASAFSAREARKCVRNAYNAPKRDGARSRTAPPAPPAPARHAAPPANVTPFPSAKAGRPPYAPSDNLAALHAALGAPPDPVDAASVRDLAATSLVEALADWANADDPTDERATDAALVAFEPNDNGNALAVRYLYPQRFLYTEPFGWLGWTGTHWQRTPEGVVGQHVIATLNRRRVAGVRSGSDKGEALVKACNPSAAHVNACLTMLRILALTPDVSVFDADPDRLNVRNGVLHLPSGVLTPHTPSQRFTYCVPAEYDPQADMAAWEAFILSAVGDKPDVAEYLQTCAGYSVTGHTNQEKMFYVYGPPRAGKGTLTETLLALLPDPLSDEVDFASFTAKRESDSQNFDLAELRPARMVIASESNRYQALNPARIKQMTGGNRIRCAFKHKDMFSYKPQFKVWLISNFPVNADADDDAAWGRIQVFTFPHSHLGAEDVGLKAALRANLAGVLRWAVIGAQRYYQQQHLDAPASVIAATKAQRDDQDYVAQWIEERCALDASGWSASSALLASYRAWCEDNGIKPERPNALADTLTKRFHCAAKRQGHGGPRGYSGIRLGFQQASL